MKPADLNFNSHGYFKYILPISFSVVIYESDISVADCATLRDVLDADLYPLESLEEAFKSDAFQNKLKLNELIHNTCLDTTYLHLNHPTSEGLILHLSLLFTLYHITSYIEKTKHYILSYKAFWTLMAGL